MTAWVLPGPPEDSPDLIQPVVGYRAWEPCGRTELCSHGLGGLEWQPGVNHAECRLRQVRTVELGRREAEDTPHDAPGGDCECGLYCMHSISGELLAWGQRGAAVGAVVVWGRVAVHREGMRAEYARIVALGLPDRAVLSPSLRQQHEQIAARYGVPLVPVVQLEEEALRHGIKLPEELLPEQPKRGREETFNQILKYTHGAHTQAYTRALQGWTNRRLATAMTPIRRPVAFVNPWTIQTQTWTLPSAKTRRWLRRLRRLRRSAIVAYLSGGSFLSMGVLILGWSWTWLFSASALFAFAGPHLCEGVKGA